MERTPVVIFEDQLRIPATAHTLAGFRQWLRSDEFPERGRIDFVAGDVEVETSPEDLLTHGDPKTAVSLRLALLILEEGRGHVYIDRTRVELSGGDLSVEPDVVVVLFDSLSSGRVQLVPTANARPDRYIELAGPPDLLVEIVSDGSVGKDTQRFPELYAQGGVPEYWLIDARGERIEFRLFLLEAGGYREAPVDADGWRRSPLLARAVRLVRQRTPVQTWHYRLETSGPGGAEEGRTEA